MLDSGFAFRGFLDMEIHVSLVCLLSTGIQNTSMASKFNSRFMLLSILECDGGCFRMRSPHLLMK